MPVSNIEHPAPARHRVGLIALMFGIVGAPRASVNRARSARRSRQFTRIEQAVAIAILAVEGIREPCAMLLARDRRAAATGQFGRCQHPIVVEIHGIEGVTQPVLVFA